MIAEKLKATKLKKRLKDYIHFNAYTGKGKTIGTENRPEFAKGIGCVADGGMVSEDFLL